MLAYDITSVTGWLMMVFLIVTILYPFLLRRRVLAAPFLQRMRLHYWLGYSIVCLMLVHAWVPMSARLAGKVNTLGLYLATIAFFLVFIQVVIGRYLAWPKLSLRRVVRRWHLGMMIALVIFVFGHIILNSPMIQLLIVHN